MFVKNMHDQLQHFEVRATAEAPLISQSFISGTYPEPSVVGAVRAKRGPRDG